jgi:formylglycine-generating enzyme required for sulfatase activity
MGDALDHDTNALPTHPVFVSAFYMDTNLVTFGLWEQIYDWALANGYAFEGPGSGLANNHPVQMVSWYDAVKWCNARSEKEGRVPAYYTSASRTEVYRTGQITNLSADWVNWVAGYRLPTEAEWEKAARGGLTGLRYPWGNTISPGLANYGKSAPITPITTSVGSYPPNGYGLYDMAGNASEWCWDWWTPTYKAGLQADPRGALSGDFRVTRGGNWSFSSRECRSAWRALALKPFGRDDIIGFRTVLPAGL